MKSFTMREAIAATPHLEEEIAYEWALYVEAHYNADRDDFELTAREIAAVALPTYLMTVELLWELLGDRKVVCTAPSFALFKPQDKMFDDVCAILEAAGGPILFAQLLASLRRSFVPRKRINIPNGGRWKGLNEQRLQAWLADVGFVFRSREHGAGFSLYIYTEPFETIVDGRGITRKVF